MTVAPAPAPAPTTADSPHLTRGGRIRVPAGAQPARRLRPCTPLRETAPSSPLPPRTARVVVIRAQKGNARDRNLYDTECIRNSVTTFEGVRVTINHQTAAADAERPEGDLRDQCGWLSDCRLEEVDGALAITANMNFAETEAGDEALRLVRSALKYQRQFPHARVWAGLSIEGHGESSEALVDGEAWNRVKAITWAPRVALVTFPAAGGKILSLRESAVPGWWCVVQELKESGVADPFGVALAFAQRGCDSSALLRRLAFLRRKLTETIGASALGAVTRDAAKCTDKATAPSATARRKKGDMHNALTDVDESGTDQQGDDARLLRRGRVEQLQDLRQQVDEAESEQSSEAVQGLFDGLRRFLDEELERARDDAAVDTDTQEGAPGTVCETCGHEQAIPPGMEPVRGGYKKAQESARAIVESPRDTFRRAFLGLDDDEPARLREGNAREVFRRSFAREAIAVKALIDRRPKHQA